MLIGPLETIVKGNEFPDDLSVASGGANKAALPSIDELARRINADALSALAEKFNGKLSRVRPVDEKDILFSEGS